MKRYVVFGGSRGLGRCLVQGLLAEPFCGQVDVVSRRPPVDVSGSLRHWPCDLSRSDQLATLLSQIDVSSANGVFYCAGGGPYGAFESKAFKAHLWAYEVSLLSAAKVIHESLKSKVAILAVGSAVAEDQVDPLAASYASSKAALLQLIATLNAENPNCDVLLASPGYMDTDLLPQNSKPRQQYQVLDPHQVAEQILKWWAQPVRETWHLQIKNAARNGEILDNP